MSERLTVEITARDGTSKVFTAISASATKAGDAVERAGKDGARELKNLDTAATKSGKSMDDLKNRATAVGAAIGVLGGAVIALGSSYRDQERQIDGINRLYGEQADAVLDTSERIQDMTRYSNDAARESFLLASSLVGNYELSTESLTLLIERSADLAQIYGFTLPDAVQRTSSALRGEGESAERLGLNMSDAAIAARALDEGITNWNVPGALSEAEKAAFRFQVFMEQTEDVVGAAGEAADDAGGNFRQFANTMQDAGQSVGGFLGPVGEVGAEMAPIAIAIPVVAAGLGRMSTALRGTAIAARAASLGVGTLSLLTNPLALALGAVVGIGVLAVKGFMDQKRAADDLANSISTLEMTYETLRRQGDTALAGMGEDLEDSFSGINDRIIDSLPSPQEINQWYSDTFGKPPPDLTSAIEVWRAEMGSAIEVTSEELTALNTLLQDALSDPSINAEAWIAWTASLIEGASGAKELDAAIQTVLTNPLSDFSRIATEANDALNESFRGSPALISAAGQAMYGQVAAQKAANVEYAALLESITAFEDATQTFLENGDNILDYWLQYQTLGRESNKVALEFNEALEKGATGKPLVMDLAADAFRELVASARDLDEAGDSLDRILTVFGQIDSLGARSSAAGSIADNLIGSVADNLAGAEAAIGTLENLWIRVASGTSDAALTQDTYNQALTAGNQIQQSNLRVQDDLTAMRAAQLPLLAQEQSAYEAMISEISQLPALEQRRALALQDSGVQAQIATQYATAYSASLNEIPEDVATSMIVNSAEADPVLKDLLLSMKLIEEVWENGEKVLKVNFPDGDTVQDSIMMLTESIDQLTIAMGGVPPLRIEADTDDLMAAIPDVQNAVEGLDGTTATAYMLGDNADMIAAIGSGTDALRGLDGNSATTYQYGINADALSKISTVSSALSALNGDSATVSIYAINAASAAINAVSAGLAAINGRTATTTIRTVYESQGLGRQQAHGGTVDGYASGGTVIPIWAGEAGPEIAHFAGGGAAWLPREGAYAVPPGTYIEPANSARGDMGGVAITFTGNFYGSNRQELNEWAESDLIPAFTNELRRHRIAAGVAA